MSETVRPFVKAAQDVVSSASRDLGVPADAVLQTLMRSVRQAHQPAKGRTQSGVAYALHGNGCLFVTPDGSEVDLDASPTGAPMFDAWRVAQWARSVGGPEAPDGDIDREAEELVRAGALTVVAPGWWAWP